jgi:epothilone synthetase B
LRFVDPALNLPTCSLPDAPTSTTIRSEEVCLDAETWSMLRRCSSLPVEAVLRAASSAVLGYWSRSLLGEPSIPLIERARLARDELDRSSVGDPPAADDSSIVTEIRSDGDGTPPMGPHSLLHHEMVLGPDTLRLRLRARAGAVPDLLLEELLATERNLLDACARRGLDWIPQLAHLLPPPALDPRRAANATSGRVGDDRLHSGFLAQARRSPRLPALISDGLRLDYGQLQAHVDAVAAQLAQSDVRRNVPIAVVMQKGWEQVVAVLAIVQAGAPYLPIDADLPLERVRYLLEDGQVELVVTQPWIDGAIAWPARIRKRLRVSKDARPDAEASAAAVAAGPDDLAYVIYTSGSTGVPKGVMITHRSAQNTVADLNRRFSVGPDDRVLGISSLSFDLSVYDVFGTLAAGAALVLPKPGHARNPRHWSNLISRERVTVWNSVPALMELLVQDTAHRQARLPPSLRLVLLSGDWIPIGLPERIRALGDVQVVSLGGATEASIWSICHPVESVDPRWRSIPYGRPLANQRFHVLNRALEPCPTWVAGDLYIAGLGLAAGYWRDEEKTRASFVHHPETGERLYRTGDLGRYLPDGAIEFLGREDSQLKVNGFRVELGEIEATLARHPGVRDVRVVSRAQRDSDERGADAAAQKPGARRWSMPTVDKILVAYVIARDGAVLGAEELKEFAAARLPAYMVPQAIVPIAELPLTANGKLDVKSLPMQTP